MYVGMHFANDLATATAISLLTNAGATHLARLAMRITSTLQPHVRGSLHPAFSPAMRSANSLLENTGAMHLACLVRSLAVPCAVCTVYSDKQCVLEQCVPNVL